MPLPNRRTEFESPGASRDAF